MGHKLSFEEFDCPPEPVGRAPREGRLLAAPVRSKRFGEGQATIRNSSAGGIGAIARQWIVAGDSIEVELPVYGWLPGHVTWVEGDRFGLAFDDRIDPNRITRRPTEGMDPYFRVTDRHRTEKICQTPGDQPALKAARAITDSGRPRARRSCARSSRRRRDAGRPT